MPTRQRTYDILVYDQDGKQIRQTVTETYEVSDEEVNAETLRNKARTALAANATYLALGNPTTAQNTAQIQRLTRQITALVRLEVAALDSTDGT